MTKVVAFLAGIFLFSPIVLNTPVHASKVETQQLSTTLHVVGQMTVERFQQLMDSKQFRSVVVNRPDEESGNMVTVARLRPIAEQAKLSLVYQPVISGKISQADIVEFAQYYNTLPKPILMICKSGTRSRLLFQQAKAQGLLNE